MTFALWCIFIGLWLPLLWSITAKWGFPEVRQFPSAGLAGIPGGLEAEGGLGAKE